MNSYLIKGLLEVIAVMLITQTVFFIIYSYLACGDAFLALRNFYFLTYNIGI